MTERDSVLENVSPLPIIVGEFGGNAGPSRVDPSDNWLFAHHARARRTPLVVSGVGLHTRARPNLIADRDYTPSQRFGVYVKQALAPVPGRN